MKIISEKLGNGLFTLYVVIFATLPEMMAGISESAQTVME